MANYQRNKKARERIVGMPFCSDSFFRLFQLGRRFLAPAKFTTRFSFLTPLAAAKDLRRSARTMAHRSPPRFFRSGGGTIDEIKVEGGSFARDSSGVFTCFASWEREEGGLAFFHTTVCSQRCLSFFFFFLIRFFLRKFLRNLPSYG